jgi:hypothetical protein
VASFPLKWRCLYLPLLSRRADTRPSSKKQTWLFCRCRLWISDAAKVGEQLYPQYGNTDHTNNDRFNFTRPCDSASASLSTIGIGTVILSPDYAFWIFCSQSKNTWCKLKRGRRRWRGGSPWGSLALWGRRESPSPSRNDSYQRLRG